MSSGGFSRRFPSVTSPVRIVTDAERCQRLPNGTVAKLRAAPHANGDAARQLPRLTMHSEEAICNWRDAVTQKEPRRGSAGPAYRRFDSFSY
jgi:hypothetical protein